MTDAAWFRELTVEARTENLDEVLAFVDGGLEERGCGPKVQMQIDVAVEEMFVNIANYAYTHPNMGRPGWAMVRMEFQGDAVVITLIDGGVPYNPLARPDPDVTLPAGERQIGGLGIYMVKKSMDSVSYEHKDGQNIFTMRKVL